MSESAQKTYRGNCHCGSFIFELTIPEITSVYVCNCSWCSKIGWQVLAVTDPENQFKVVKGDENSLRTYRFGQRMHHKFCPVCGSMVLSRYPAGPVGHQMAINARMLQDFDPWAVKEHPIDGASHGDPYKVPRYEGPEPSAEIEGAKTYHGSCHCGNVKVAFKMKPLDAMTADSITACNCSICVRNSYIWTWLAKDQIYMTGKDSVTHYTHGIHMFVKGFCSNCGVNVSSVARTVSEAELKVYPEGFLKVYEMAQAEDCVNLRLLNNVSLSTLKPQKMDGWNRIQPLYVNP